MDKVATLAWKNTAFKSYWVVVPFLFTNFKKGIFWPILWVHNNNVHMATLAATDGHQARSSDHRAPAQPWSVGHKHRLVSMWCCDRFIGGSLRDQLTNTGQTQGHITPQYSSLTTILVLEMRIFSCGTRKSNKESKLHRGQSTSPQASGGSLPHRTTAGQEQY